MAVTKNSPNYPIHNAIKKYGDRLVITTLVEGSDEYCLDVEYKLRPTPNLSWNISAGGGAPMLGKAHTEDVKARMSAHHSSPEQREKHRQRALAVPTWEHGSSDKIIWSSAESIFDCYLAHNCEIGPVLLARAFNLGNKQLEAMLKKFRLGWNPHNDHDWKSWSLLQDGRLGGGWKSGDELMQPKEPFYSEEAKAARAKGGKRVWSDDDKEHMRQLNIGRKHTPETLEKLSRLLTGKKRSDEQKAVIKQRLKDCPWTNATAYKENWAKADYMKSVLDGGGCLADLLRELGLDRKSGRLTKIVAKLKFGWNPTTDPEWLEFSAKYKVNEQESHEQQEETTEAY